MKTPHRLAGVWLTLFPLGLLTAGEERPPGVYNSQEETQELPPLPKRPAGGRPRFLREPGKRR